MGVFQDQLQKLSEKYKKHYLPSFCRGRIVRVPKGPLIRVVGTEVAIPCSVSDYDGPSEQNFDWEFARETDFVRIVSTWDSTFTSEEYQKRVGHGDIKLRRSSNDAVELVIKNIQPTDQGKYKCSTPSTDATVQGNYDAEVQVKVISDGLLVSGSKARSSTSLKLSEGDSFKLRCSAITTSPEHTHLHVTWQIKSGLSWQDILSLTHEGKFQPGPGYEERYRNGDIRLDTGVNDTYRLSVSQASSVDAGVYRCLVSEWVRGADSSWQKIQEKSVEIASVSIQRTVLDVLISTSNLSVTERDSLDLTCNITTDRSGIFQAEVTWYFSGSPDDTLSDAQVLLSMDHDSVVSDSTLISLSHVDRNSYRLLVRDVGVEDSGYYFCQAAVWVPLHNGSWHKVVERTSAPVSVVVTALEPDYEVFLNASKTPKFSDDPTELECRITNAQDTEANIRFTVSWYYKEHLLGDDVATEELLATMDADWTLLLGDRSRERTQNGEIIFSKKAADTFSLRIQWTSESDRGDYFCVISAWSRHRNNSWVKSKDVTSAPVSILWATQDYTLTVEAVKLKPFFVAGHTFEMTCKVSSKNIKTPRYSVLITAEKPLTDQSNPNGTTRIISLNQDSVVRLEDWTDQTRVDGVVLEKVQENEFRYRMYQTQISDAGLYRCVVTAWSPGGGGMWREAVNGLSNPIQIDFQTSGPVFNVSVHSDNLTIYQGELADLLCIITTDGMALEPDDMSFDVSWFAVRSFALDREPVLLATVDRRGIVTQSRRNGSSDLSLERISPLEFRLRVHGCEDHDFGNHYCVVTPWVRSATGVWQREPAVKAKPVFLSVKMDVLNAFKYPLLIGIGLATVIGLLSCLIGYCSSRWCCKKEVQETRRERRRLMSMEMD
ncbi:prostaglandin F2 receptor negative regulator isoform X2 [Anser cygnoides]|uniref:Prostaglandin F2 receptor inhibitor n=1 Tax=Anser cygnoides TaxID=8845 RepID=A0A8B9DS20_ANSCY|nr:prostaglandin F2 receptor negative regulator isoform X3 [Anser cygnoides]XP_047927544.1 prostaglandin F2 receptor negative regulator isoform X3 [Anser cygnoides]